jgi:predicted XRE-type DNA-binding protein
MKPTKAARLAADGWAVGDVEDFLGLTPEESSFIDLKIALSRELRERRKHAGLTQVELATRLRTSQSRVAKMERADSVSMDLLVMALLVLGSTRADVARVISAGVA